MTIETAFIKDDTQALLKEVLINFFKSEVAIDEKSKVLVMLLSLWVKYTSTMSKLKDDPSDTDVRIRAFMRSVKANAEQLLADAYKPGMSGGDYLIALMERTSIENNIAN